MNQTWPGPDLDLTWTWQQVPFQVMFEFPFEVPLQVPLKHQFEDPWSTPQSHPWIPLHPECHPECCPECPLDCQDQWNIVRRYSERGFIATRTTTSLSRCLLPVLTLYCDWIFYCTDCLILTTNKRVGWSLHWLGVFKCLYQRHCTVWGYLNI